MHWFTYKNKILNTVFIFSYKQQHTYQSWTVNGHDKIKEWLQSSSMPRWVFLYLTVKQEFSNSVAMVIHRLELYFYLCKL